MRAATLGRSLCRQFCSSLSPAREGPVSDISGQRVVVITVTPASPTIEVGSTIQLSALARDVNSEIVNGASFVGSSFNTSVATVDPNGLVTAVAVGNAIVDARIPGVAVTAGSASIHVAAAAASGGR